MDGGVVVRGGGGVGRAVECLVRIGSGWSWSAGEGGEEQTINHAIVVADVLKIVGTRVGGGSAMSDEVR